MTPVVEQQTVEDIELEGDAEVPIGSGPHDLRGMLEEIGKHAQHAHHLEPCIAMHGGREGVKQREEHEAHDEDTEKLQVVIADEAPDAHVGQGPLLILLHQSEAAEEEEHGHAIMAEEGDEV